MNETRKERGMSVQLHLGDCLEVMRTMPDKSVDAVITDPPYNIGKAEWDKIPNYIEWCGEWIGTCERVLKDNGSFYFFHNDMEQIADLMLWIRNNTNFVFKQFIVWNKRFDGAKNKGFLDGFVVPEGLRNYQQMAEYCLFYTFQDETGLTLTRATKECFYSIKKYLDDELDGSGYTEQTIKDVLNNDMNSHYFGFSKRDKSQFCLPTKEQYSKLQSTGYFRREYEDLRREYEDLRYTFNNQKTHHSVWNYEIAERSGHCTPKPVGLIENILAHSTNEGMTVLDCFAGSGTTGVACVQTGRNFIGIEIDPTHFAIAERRIKEAQLQLRLPLEAESERFTVHSDIERQDDKWIPVSERLPEDLQSIIVFTKDRKTYIIRFLELYGREGFGSLSDIVTHWMPLPESPIVYGKEREE